MVSIWTPTRPADSTARATVFGISWSLRSSQTLEPMAETAHNFGAFRGIKLQPDFEKRDLVAQLFDELKRCFLCRHIQCDNDFVSCFCHPGHDFVMSSEVSRRSGIDFSVDR